MFRAPLSIACAAGLLIAADAPKPDPTKDDQDKVQGTWVLVSLQSDGEKLPADAIKDHRLTVGGKSYVFTVGDKVTSRGTQKLDATKKPSHIDITATEGKDKGQVVQGIYVLEKDDLKVCYIYPTPAEGGRPVEFQSKPGSKHVLLLYQREK